MEFIEKIKELKKRMEDAYSLLDEIEDVVLKFLEKRRLELGYHYETDIFMIPDSRKQDISDIFKSQPLVEFPVHPRYDYIYILEDGRVVGAKDKIVQKDGKVTVESKYSHIGWIEGDE